MGPGGANVQLGPIKAKAGQLENVNGETKFVIRSDTNKILEIKDPPADLVPVQGADGQGRPVTMFVDKNQLAAGAGIPKPTVTSPEAAGTQSSARESVESISAIRDMVFGPADASGARGETVDSGVLLAANLGSKVSSLAKFTSGFGAGKTLLGKVDLDKETLEKGKRLRIRLKGVLAARIKAQSGKTVNERELEDNLERFMPGPFDDAETVQLRLQILDEFNKDISNFFDPSTGKFKTDLLPPTTKSGSLGGAPPQLGTTPLPETDLGGGFKLLPQ